MRRGESKESLQFWYCSFNCSVINTKHTKKLLLWSWQACQQIQKLMWGVTKLETMAMQFCNKIDHIYIYTLYFQGSLKKNNMIIINYESKMIYEKPLAKWFMIIKNIFLFPNSNWLVFNMEKTNPLFDLRPNQLKPNCYLVYGFG